MIANLVRTQLRRLAVFLALPLVAASVAVALAGTPAHAGGLVYYGNFRITNSLNCLEPLGSANRSHIVLGTCGSTDNTEKWAIFLDSDRNVYWILAYAGDQSLNKCMDAPNSYVWVWVYGCYGQSQQWWTLSPTTTGPQQIRHANTNYCLGIIADFHYKAAQINCSSAPYWSLVPA